MHDRHIAAVVFGLALLTAGLPLCLHAGAQAPAAFETQRQSAEAVIVVRMKPDALPRLGFAEDSPFGVCGSAFAAEHLDRLGLTWARMGVPEFKPEQAETWLDTKGDRFPFSGGAKAVLDAGGRVPGLINFKDAAKWTEAGDDGYLDVVSECTRKMVEAHKDRIHHWEVINEPDVFSPGVTPQQMAPIVKAAIRGARQADPDCFLLSPCPTSITYMEALLEEGIGPMVDGFAFHVYSQGGAMPNVLRHWKQLYADYGQGDKPVWITETGWRSDVGHAEGEAEKTQWFRHLDDQAQVLVKGHVRMLAAGIERIVWYNLTDVSAARAKENFGLLWSAGGPRGRGKQGKSWRIPCDHVALKPSGLASHVLARTLGLCPDYRRRIHAGIGIHVFEFHADDGPVLVAWARDGRVLPVPASAEEVHVTDLYGGTHAFPVADGRCRLRLGPGPVYIRGADADALARPDWPIAWRENTAVKPGDRASVPVALTNTAEVKLTGTVILMPAPGLFTDPESINLNLKAGGRYEGTVTLTAHATTPPGTYRLRWILHRADGRRVSQFTPIRVIDE
jgi:hypothetical protein